jgi:hypothetical protein
MKGKLNRTSEFKVVTPRLSTGFVLSATRDKGNLKDFEDGV